MKKRVWNALPAAREWANSMNGRLLGKRILERERKILVCAAVVAPNFFPQK
jgi:hypothetical protein